MPASADQFVELATKRRQVGNLAGDPTNTNRLFAVTYEGEILSSGDGGRSWASLTA